MDVKIDNWRKYLANYVSRMKDVPFEFAVNDCLTFALGAIETMIGYELEKPILNYASKLELVSFNSNHSLQDGLKAQLPIEEIKPRFQTAGDILIHKLKGYECAHVCMGKYSYIPDGNGLLTLDTHKLINMSLEGRLNLQILRVR